MCPICTIGVAVGVGLSRYLGVDDLISGIWIGAFLIYLVLWTTLFLKKRISVWIGGLISFILWYGLVIFPLYQYDIIGHPLNRIWGIDKLVLGIVLGSLLLPIGIGLSEFIKRKNNNKVLFPFQKVIIPLSLLLVASLIILIIQK